MELRRRGNKLTIQADGEPDFEMEHDRAGEAYALEFDDILRRGSKSTTRSRSHATNWVRFTRLSA